MKIRVCYFFLFCLTCTVSAETDSLDSNELIRLTSNIAKAHVNVSREPLDYDGWVEKYLQSQSSAQELYRIAKSLGVMEKTYNQSTITGKKVVSNFLLSLKKGNLKNILQSMKEIIRLDDLQNFNSCTLKDEINNITLLTRDIDPIFKKELGDKCKNISQSAVAYSDASSAPSSLVSKVAGGAGLAGLISLIVIEPTLSKPEQDDPDYLDETPISP